MAKNNFTKAVNSFFEKIKVTKTFRRKSEMCSGDAFLVTVTYNGKSCRFMFHDNYRNESSKEEILYCLLSDAEAFDYSLNYGDFAYVYGYKLCTKARKAYNGCKRQSERLHKLFTDEEIALLSMIVNE